jgi:hypothetical protein
MKKSRKMLIALLIVLACLGGTIFGISIKYPGLITYYIDAINSYKRAYLSTEDFNRCYDDFITTANFAIEYEDAHGMKKKHYLYFDDFDGVQLYDSDTYDPIVSDEQNRLSLSKINEGFRNSGGKFERIDVNEH